MIGTLKCPYPGLTTETTSEILSQIQTSIRQKVNCFALSQVLAIHLLFSTILASICFGPLRNAPVVVSCSTNNI